MENGLNEEKSASRAENNDLIICCNKKNPYDKDKIIIKRFGVEKAVLAWHSAFFENTFDTCDNSEEKGEVPLPEQVDVVQTFLNCIYGLDTAVWAFDLCTDVIEMARNYEARIVEKQAYVRLCAAFETLSRIKDNHSMHTRYGKLYILKFMQNLRQAKKEQFAEAMFLEKSLKERNLSILESCGMGSAVELNSSTTRGYRCPHCRRDGGLVSAATISGPSFSINHLFTEDERSFFSVNELLEFKLCLILQATSNPDSDFYESFVKESF